MKPEIELAQLVIDWSKIDDKVAEQGWDGGERDGEWDNCKNAMVAAAQDILEGEYKPKADDVEFKIVHRYGVDGIVGIGFTVHPATKNKDGFVSVRMIHSESCKIREQALEPIHLFFNDLCSVLSVLIGIEQSSEIDRHHGVLPVSRKFSVGHYIEEDPSSHGFRFVLSTSLGPMEGDFWVEHAEFTVSHNEAVGLREVLGHSMLLVGCGLPSSMRKAGE